MNLREDRFAPRSDQLSARAFSAARAKNAERFLARSSIRRSRRSGRVMFTRTVRSTASGRGDEKGHRIAVLGIGHDHFQRARRGQLLAILDHTADMKLDRFLGHAAGLIECRAGAHTTREVRKVYAEIARSFRSDKTNIARH
jgi:hypothetical protein